MRTAHHSEEDNGPAWLAALLHSTDSAYPIGGFAHSGGLEGLTGTGHINTADDLGRFLNHEVADTLQWVELPLLNHAWLAATAEDEAALIELDVLSEAVRFGAEPRQASRRLGSQRWSLFETLHADQLDPRTRDWTAAMGKVLPHKHLCIVAGIEAVALGMPAAAAMTGMAHQTVMMVAQAALKLIRVGQKSVQGLVVRMAARYPQLIQHARTLECADVGTCLPRYDIGTAWHETAPARMFLS
ncbi:MAG: urease accessory protein UreF [Verrucomicrobiaceae bacterium]|nr:urease accessory protein UreF [Verrucomicrobiaceae bacterium]